MARNPSKTLTERESQIMEVLWRSKTATAELIRSELPDELHDSSVRTILRVLIEKGHVKAEPGSKPKAYKPAVSQSAAQRNATKNFLNRFFDGSAESFVLRLLEDEQLTMEQVDELRASLGKAQVNKKGRK